MEKDLKGNKLWELVLEKSKERDRLAKTFESKLEEGVRTFINDNRKQEAYVHPSSKKDRIYQFSFFDNDGPVGDFEAQDFAEVAVKVIEYGFVPCEEEDFKYSVLALNKTQTNQVQGLTGFTNDEILLDVENHINDLLYEDDDIEIIKIGLCGSRILNEATNTSDLDVIIEYSGLMSEDDLFNVLNADPLMIEGIQIDFSPYSIDKGNGVENYEQLNSMIVLYDKENFKSKPKIKNNEIGHDM